MRERLVLDKNIRQLEKEYGVKVKKVKLGSEWFYIGYYKKPYFGETHTYVLNKQVFSTLSDLTTAVIIRDKAEKLSMKKPSMEHTQVDLRRKHLGDSGSFQHLFGLQDVDVVISKNQEKRLIETNMLESFKYNCDVRKCRLIVM